MSAVPHTVPSPLPVSDAGPVPTAAALRERAIALQPTILEHAADTERRGTYGPELHERFVEAGFYKALMPRRHGGYELDLKDVFRAQLEVARGDLSTGWCMSLASNHALEVASWFSLEGQDGILGGGDFRAASVAAPTVAAQRVQDGWHLSGQVAYCSGIPWSTHYLGQAMLPGTNAKGEPKLLLFVAPRDTFDILDDWGDTLGLRGSGSNSIRFHEDVVIPESWGLEDANMVDFPVTGGTPGYAIHGNPLYGGRAMCTFAISLGMLVLGAAYAACDEYEHWMRTKQTPMPPFVPRTEDPDFQRWLGSAWGKLQMVEAALLSCLDQHAEYSRLNSTGEREYTFADDHRIGVAAREAFIFAWEAVEKDLYRTIGSSAARNGQRFERIFRDLAMAAGHRNTLLRETSYRDLANLRIAGAYAR
jgi:3-hydroxy-9,10-secoandrosta-1,3,5(10)-triene-9,17-dione monooxygenase